MYLCRRPSRYMIFPVWDESKDENTRSLCGRQNSTMEIFLVVRYEIRVRVCSVVREECGTGPWIWDLMRWTFIWGIDC